MNRQSQALHEKAIVALTHDHTMYGLAVRRSRGERAVFSTTYAPQMHQGGVKMIGWVIGGDPPLFGVDLQDAWWGTLELIDMFLQEAGESADSLTVCLNYRDIENALAKGKVAAIMTMEGGMALGESGGLGTLVRLRTLYRLGLRSLQFVGQDWNALIDARGTHHPTPSKGLTKTGREVVREMNRLGMLIDMAHVPDPDPMFWDVLEASRDPIIDSHRGACGVNDVPRNISDERIKAIAEKGGVIGLQFFSVTLGSPTGERSTVNDLVRHIDHIVEIGGIDCVALGPDYLEAGLLDRSAEHYAKGIETIDRLPQVTDALVKSGYDEDDIRKILGENILRVYRRVIGYESR